MAEPIRPTHDAALLLRYLKTTHEEVAVDQPLCREGEMGSALYQTLTTEGGQRAIRHLTPANAGEIVEKFLPLSRNLLFLAEAAARIPDAEVVETCCKKWGEEFVSEIGKDREDAGLPANARPGLYIGGIFLGGPAQSAPASLPSSQEVSAFTRRVEKIERELAIPSFQDVKLLEQLLIAIKSSRWGIHVFLKQVPATEATVALRAKTNSILATFVLDAAPSASRQILVERFAPEIRNWNLSARGDSLTDESIGRVLRDFPQLEILDLSNCIKLTPACLDSGHSRLQKLILTGTQIKAADIKYAKFPVLEREKVENVNPISVVDLGESLHELRTGSDIFWTRFAAAVAQATVIVPASGNFDDLARELIRHFSKEPSVAKFNAMLSLRANFNKIQSRGHSVFGMNIPENLLLSLHNQFDPKFLPEILQMWSDPQTWRKPELGAAMTKWLVGMLSQFDIMKKETSDLLWDKLLSQFGPTPQTYCHYAWQRGELNRPLVHSLLSQFIEQAGTVGTLTSNKESILQGTLKRLVQTSEGDILAHAVACTLALDGFELEARRDLLSAVLDRIRSGRPFPCTYPLAKLVVGCAADRDFPATEQNTPFAAYLKNYTGIFRERKDSNALDDLKRQFLEVLYDGRLGKGTDVVEALLYLHQKMASERPRIQSALERLDQEPNLMQRLVASNCLSPESVILLKGFSRLPNALQAIEAEQQKQLDKALGDAPSFFAGIED